MLLTCTTCTLASPFPAFFFVWCYANVSINSRTDVFLHFLRHKFLTSNVWFADYQQLRPLPTFKAVKRLRQSPVLNYSHGHEVPQKVFSEKFSCEDHEVDFVAPWIFTYSFRCFSSLLGFLQNNLIRDPRKELQEQKKNPFNEDN